MIVVIVALLAVAVLVGVQALLASNRTLKFNSRLGLRIYPVTANENAWVAGHTAAAPALGAGSAGAAAAAVVAVVSPELAAVLAVLGIGWALGCTVWAAVRARRAARRHSSASSA